MTAEKTENSHKDTYAIVGELVLIASALDDCLNRVVIAFLELGDAHLLLPVVATLDPARKIEILKARVTHLAAKDWKKAFKSFVDRIETVNKHRNIACHTPPIFENGKWTLKPIAAAKLLQRLDLEKKTLSHFSFHDLKNAISVGEQALAQGVELTERMAAVKAEKSRRAAAAKST